MRVTYEDHPDDLAMMAFLAQIATDIIQALAYRAADHIGRFAQRGEI